MMDIFYPFFRVNISDTNTFRLSQYHLRSAIWLSFFRQYEIFAFVHFFRDFAEHYVELVRISVARKL